MAISIDWPSGVITVQQSDTDILTLVSGTLYEMDTIAFQKELKDLEDSDWGMPWPDTHTHALESTISGTTYVRALNVINGYSITFLPNSQWTAVMDGASNNNFHDVAGGILNQNQVQVIPANSAGNTVTETGVSGLTAEESTNLTELHKVYGLKVGSPVIHRKDPAQIEFDSEAIKLTEDVDGNVTAERQ